MSYFIFENKEIFYEEKGEGTPLLILHGNTGSSNMFAGFADRYSTDFKVVLIDFLGHGRSDRLSEFPSDLWFYEAQQVIAFLREKGYEEVFLIGSSGGAMVAINVALEAPELVSKVIADSFEGEHAGDAFTDNLLRDRAMAKENPGARGFYEYMHGADWEQVVDNDTSAILRHAKEVGEFFHKPISELKADILLTGSREDKFMYSIADNYYEDVYGEILSKIGHGKMHLFGKGDHPAMISNFDEFYDLSIKFLK
ncbi:MAG: alpha/beta hydrolase [Lachnospiraceae bacterium]|nr:alpha/beta hydrolase [Lachnospiraceae bacterium]